MEDPVKQKQVLIKKLRDAKKSHRRWVTKAQTMIEGVPVQQDQLPLEHTSCNFGLWYYGEGQLLSPYSAFRKIEEPHQKLHDLYREIFSLLFSERKPSLFQRLLGKKTKRSKEELAQAKQLLAQLNSTSLEILERIDELEKVIKNLSDADLERLFRLFESRKRMGAGQDDA